MARTYLGVRRGGGGGVFCRKLKSSQHSNKLLVNNGGYNWNQRKLSKFANFVYTIAGSRNSGKGSPQLRKMSVVSVVSCCLSGGPSP